MAADLLLEEGCALLCDDEDVLRNAPAARGFERRTVADQQAPVGPRVGEDRHHRRACRSATSSQCPKWPEKTRTPRPRAAASLRCSVPSYTARRSIGSRAVRGK